MQYSLDNYTPIDRWSQQLPSDGELSAEQAALNDGARRLYAARQHALARHRLIPWFSNFDTTLDAEPRSESATPASPPPPRSLPALPSPATAVAGYLH